MAHFTHKNLLFILNPINMREVVFSAFICLNLIFCAQTLNCRTDGGPSESELRKTYRECLNRQERSDNQGNYDDQDGRDSHQYQKPQRGFDKMSFRNDGNNRNTGGGRYESSDQHNRNDRRDEDSYSRSDRNGNRDDRTSSRDDWTSAASSTRGSRYDREERLSGREDFRQSDEYGSEMSHYNYRSSTQPSRRFKREKRQEKNSGQRSQYNPNTSSDSSPRYSKYGGDSYRSNERNSSDRNMTRDAQACALHCFLEELEMIGDDGMPDRYLVTHAMTKDVKNNEELRNFIQESIDDCFQLIYYENNDDKCDYSKNLLLCLSEKGRANCADWNDDMYMKQKMVNYPRN